MGRGLYLKSPSPFLSRKLPHGVLEGGPPGRGYGDEGGVASSREGAWPPLKGAAPFINASSCKAIGWLHHAEWAWLLKWAWSHKGGRGLVKGRGLYLKDPSPF